MSNNGSLAASECSAGGLFAIVRAEEAGADIYYGIITPTAFRGAVENHQSRKRSRISDDAEEVESKSSMNDEQNRQPADQSVDPRIVLAIKRTELAEDRTMLAWLRTALALMAAGVAFDKGAQLLHEKRLAAGTALVQSSHLVGLSLTAATTALLILVLFEYRKRHRELARAKGGTVPVLSPISVASVLVILLGIAVLAALIISN